MSAMICIILVFCLFNDTRALILAPTPWTKTVWFFFFINIVLVILLILTAKKAVEEYNQRRKDEEEAKKLFELQQRDRVISKYTEDEPPVQDETEPLEPAVPDEDDPNGKYYS